MSTHEQALAEKRREEEMEQTREQVRLLKTVPLEQQQSIDGFGDAMSDLAEEARTLESAVRDDDDSNVESIDVGMQNVTLNDDERAKLSAEELAKREEEKRKLRHGMTGNYDS